MEMQEFEDFISIIIEGEMYLFDKDVAKIILETDCRLFINRRSATPKLVMSTDSGAVCLKRLVYGSVPEGNCLVFRDGDYRNLRRDNIIAVPRGRVWIYSFNPNEDTQKCIRKHRESGYSVVVSSVYYGRYMDKGVAIQCRNNIISDLKRGVELDKKHYKKVYRNRDILALLENEEFDILESRYGNAKIQ